MFQIANWLKRRLTCLLYGHQMYHTQIYYPPASDIVPGYKCKRCGKTQLVLYRWQTIE